MDFFDLFNGYRPVSRKLSESVTWTFFINSKSCKNMQASFEDQNKQYLQKKFTLCTLNNINLIVIVLLNLKYLLNMGHLLKITLFIYKYSRKQLGLV